jgi:hypothetical protein
MAPKHKQSLIGLGRCHYLYAHETTVTADILGHFREAEKYFTIALEMYTSLGEQEDVEEVGYDLKVLYQDWSNYSEKL